MNDLISTKGVSIMYALIKNNPKLFGLLTVSISCLIFILFLVFVLPAEAMKSSELGLESSPDTSLYYTAQTLYDIAESYGEKGRSFYIQQRFTFDLVWPIAYGLFLFVVTAFLMIKLKVSQRIYKLLWLPVLAVVFDYFENMMTALVMYRYPNKTFLIDGLAGVMTLIKWLTLSAAFIALIVFLALLIFKRFKSKAMTIF